MPRGFFISLDGLDGCGKSAQCQLLADHFRSQGSKVTPCVDPGGTVVGAQLREILLHHRQEIAPACEALLFMASRAQLVAEVIRPALDVGHIVISDRYLLANVVYQGHAGGLDPTQLWQVGQLSTGGLQPDLTVVLDLPVEVAQRRRTGPRDRVESRGSEYHERVRKGFLFEAEQHRDRMRVVDADRLPQEVFQAILLEVEKFDLGVPK
jgi:dTMP kinase